MLNVKLRFFVYEKSMLFLVNKEKSIFQMFFIIFLNNQKVFSPSEFFLQSNTLPKVIFRIFKEILSIFC